MKNILMLYVFILYLVHGAHVQAVPLESTSENASDNGSNSSAAAEANKPTDSASTTSDDNESISGELSPDQSAAASNYDSNIYAGLVSPDAFQQYVNQFGGAYGPYAAPYPAPFPAAYPAPVGFGPPPPFPSPYVVQTGYEGYLVPSTTISTATKSASALDLLTYLRSLIPDIMTTTIFRVLTAIASAIGVIFFGGAITTAICSLTPLCDISFKAVTYLKRRGEKDGVGKMIAEEITPERVRRASDFVWKAIRKYNELQKSIENE